MGRLDTQIEVEILTASEGGSGGGQGPLGAACPAQGPQSPWDRLRPAGSIGWGPWGRGGGRRRGENQLVGMLTRHSSAGDPSKRRVTKSSSFGGPRRGAPYKRPSGVRVHWDTAQISRIPKQFENIEFVASRGSYITQCIHIYIYTHIYTSILCIHRMIRQMC